MAATEGEGGALAALMRAALALPILGAPASAAALAGEAGVSFLHYRERGLIRVNEPIVWARLQPTEAWEVAASAALDIVSGASPETVTNVSGTPVQTVTAASVRDRRQLADVKVTRRFGNATVSVSRAISDEDDYRSRAHGIEASLELDDKQTKLTVGFGHSNDRVRSATDAALDERRDVREALVGLTQVISPVAIVQSTLAFSRGRGWYNDPYKNTLTFYPEGGPPAFLPDLRPDGRDSLAWLTRFRRHVPDARGTLQLDYRFFRDDWKIRSHTLEAAWHQELSERWAVRPALRYYTQSAARFYSPVIPRDVPEVLSSDQRLAAFGGISPSVRVVYRPDLQTTFEATAGLVRNDARYRLGGSGSDAYVPLRASYFILSFARAF